MVLVDDVEVLATRCWRANTEINTNVLNIRPASNEPTHSVPAGLSVHILQGFDFHFQITAVVAVITVKVVGESTELTRFFGFVICH